MKVYLGIGSNLGSRHKHLEFAVTEIAQHHEISNIKTSAIYESPAIEVVDKQNDFLNLCLTFDFPSTNENIKSAQKLLKYLQKIELSAKRERPYFHSPRTLDIDILIYGTLQTQIKTPPQLHLPHPQIINRLFVLCPLVELLNINSDKCELQRTEQLLGVNINTQIQTLKQTQVINSYS